ncbi:acyl-CoA dehydrogenase family protein [Pseudodonghicola flavimaris]|uniref:Acyl-CoA dehydrogenase family protein n=1 Tax=Pseudodonghicola flavimaris TaxID=3050036 RepID=A0ABT7EXX9_9RHOB|nr:acyl-CoA dehydrogenase family protein [Pseudodonghicola flavimaris]MDK3017201.1 acyl-CoA dehydrogenase family protein [Pseudodonghicola flavimaris]
MKPFAAPLDDILFSLTHVAGVDALPGWDAEMAAGIGAHFAAFAEGEIAPLDASGDLQGCRLENGRVRMPDGFAAAYRAYADQGWPGLTAPEEAGGQGMGALMLAITSEIFSGANHALQMVTGLVPGAIRTLQRFGTEDQKARHLPGLASGATLATMCLTEPGAGSDLARVRCRAEPDGAVWRITGEKIFISGGDQDMSPRILHLVLARTSDDGIRGLSLFLCSSECADGSRNAVAVTRIEEKMGLHASPTCQLAFDGAEAELIGREGQGLRAMFTMMNHARADVALQGVAHAARAHDVAASYAAERSQGRLPDGASARLDQHADVRRMLDEIDALALGGRGVVHLAYAVMEAGEDPALVEFLTPVAKVLCTEGGMRAAELGTQVLGGYGYLREYRLEQTYRDARITAIYEGANGIHARMLATRLLGGAEAEAFDRFLTGEAVAQDGLPALWRRARAHLLGLADPTPQAHDFMQLTALVLLDCIWARILSSAGHHADPERLMRVARAAADRGRCIARAHAACLGVSV